ncbi:MAG: pirin family protein [Rikenellaceae bacterium]|nr:pirin family protein [Rikenellaceae bacterium]
MKMEIYRADSRGGANHGWLLTRHTFSFANYYDPKRIHFGALRVVNDDTVAPGEGFDMHPHNDMEIVSIPLEGTLEHRDSMGNVSVISKGEVQVMSAGTGILHSEYNYSDTDLVKFLQIWVFTRQKDLTPRYSQVKIHQPEPGEIELIVAPEGQEHVAWIHQDAWFSLANVPAGGEVAYELHKPGNGVFMFVIEGAVSVGGERFDHRDGVGITDAERFTLAGDKASQILLMEVPM